jgi:hypothetical protein
MTQEEARREQGWDVVPSPFMVQNVLGVTRDNPGSRANSVELPPATLVSPSSRESGSRNMNFDTVFEFVSSQVERVENSSAELLGYKVGQLETVVIESPLLRLVEFPPSLTEAPLSSGESQVSTLNQGLVADGDCRFSLIATSVAEFSGETMGFPSRLQECISGVSSQEKQGAKSTAEMPVDKVGQQKTAVIESSPSHEVKDPLMEAPLSTLLSSSASQVPMYSNYWLDGKHSAPLRNNIQEKISQVRQENAEAVLYPDVKALTHSQSSRPARASKESSPSPRKAMRASPMDNSEINRLLKAYKKHGNDFDTVAKYVRTRTSQQVSIEEMDVINYERDCV